MSGLPPLRVPEEDGGFLAVPSLSQTGELLQLSRQHFQSAPSHVRAWREEARPSADAVLVSGHQPELFHPGVWIKNFVLHRLARTHGGVSLNLIVDNDVVKAPTLLEPSLEGETPRVIAVPFDSVPAGLPYEEWTVRDEGLFASLPERAGAKPQAALKAFWDEVRQQAQRTNNVPERFAAARRVFERRWGCHNVETPLSAICRTETFARFATHILNDLPRFHEVFNAALREYRKLNRLKSHHHPFPDLTRDGDWLEAPFWTWRTDAPTRRRLFVRPTANGFELRPGGRITHARLARDWMRLEQEGHKIRSRALTTTLFARLCIADIFMHGIGGGKYDTVTDTVIQRFFNVAPPPFLVVTGTLRLPLPTYSATPEDVRRLARRLRDLEFNPQRHLQDDERTHELLTGRREWVAREGKRERWKALRHFNAELSPFLTEQRREVEAELTRCRAQVEANANVLRRRDWAFVLYPEILLREFLTRSPGVSG